MASECERKANNCEFSNSAEGRYPIVRHERLTPQPSSLFGGRGYGFSRSVRIVPALGTRRIQWIRIDFIAISAGPIGCRRFPPEMQQIQCCETVGIPVSLITFVSREHPSNHQSLNVQVGTESLQMDQAQLNWLTNFIWNIADDVLRDVYVRGKYRDVILPMTVLRRLDAVLEPTKDAVKT